MNTSNPRKYVIVQGLTREGSRFRPSDWAERLCGLLATMDRRQRVVYSPMLVPFSYDGVKSVAMDLTLEDQNPAVFGQIMRFADSNQLQLRYPEVAEQAHVA